MSRRVPLLEFCDVLAPITRRAGYCTVLTPDHIRTMRHRASKAGKPSPYPFVLREEGRHALLADLDAYARWAAANGRPAYPGSLESGGSAR